MIVVERQLLSFLKSACLIVFVYHNLLANYFKEYQKMINRRQFLQTSSLLSLTILARPSFALPKTMYIDNTDVAIIGSGPAGLSLASRLTQSGIKVIVIESGPLNGYSERAQKRNKVLDAGYGLPYTLGVATKRMTGGTSNVWGGVCPRLQADDLRCKSKFDYAADWPITYQELEHYYCKAENFLQVFNPIKNCSSFTLTDGSASLAQNLRTHGFKDTVAASVTVNSHGDFQALRLKHSHLPGLLKNKNFSLFTNVTARSFNVDTSGKVKSVLGNDNEGNVIKINCKTVVICAGAIQSSRLLMLLNNQRTGFSFGADGGHLGANFMDHPAVKMTIFENPSKEILSRHEPLPPVKFGQAHIWQWYGHYRKQGVGAYLPFVVQNSESNDLAKVKILKFSILCEQEPLRENRFELSNKETDEFGDPLPKLWYKSSDFDKRTYLHAITNMKQFMEKSQSLKAAEKIDIHLGRHHLMGTTKMALNDKEGVVDKNLKVFGSNNIYVLGGSVFPSGGAANPTLTIVALALRLAKHLIQIRV